METKIKAFDAVAESRKWREAASRNLDAMPVEQRLAYLKGVRGHYAAERKRPAHSNAIQGSPMTFRVVLIKSEEGFSVGCPALPGCWSQGETRKLPSRKGGELLHRQTAGPDQAPQVPLATSR